MLAILLTTLFGMIQPNTTFHDFSFKDSNGKTVSLSAFKGKKILVVNTASECGYTSQYADLQKLHEQYGERLVVIAFPANEFGGQEPGTDKEIRSFCSTKYNITFPIAAKSVVKGKEMSELFEWLTTQPNPDFTGDIRWNFEKFLIDEKGRLIHRYRSSVKPMDKAITGEL